MKYYIAAKIVANFLYMAEQHSFKVSSFILGTIYLPRLTGLIICHFGSINLSKKVFPS